MSQGQKFSEPIGTSFSEGGTNLHGPLKEGGRLRHSGIPLGSLKCFDYTRAFIFRKGGTSEAALLTDLEVYFI